MTMVNTSFCEGPFWDLSIVWDTPDPDFTPCFQRTVLSWLPTIVLVLLSPVELLMWRGSTAEKIPYSVLNLTKMTISSGLVVVAIVEAAELGGQSDPSMASVVAPLIEMMGYFLSTVLLFFSLRFDF